MTNDQLRDVEATARMIENAANTLVISALSEQISGGQFPLEVRYVDKQIEVMLVGLATLKRIAKESSQFLR